MPSTLRLCFLRSYDGFILRPVSCGDLFILEARILRIRGGVDSDAVAAARRLECGGIAAVRCKFDHAEHRCRTQGQRPRNAWRRRRMGFTGSKPRISPSRAGLAGLVPSWATGFMRGYIWSRSGFLELTRQESVGLIPFTVDLPGTPSKQRRYRVPSAKRS